MKPARGRHNSPIFGRGECVPVDRAMSAEARDPQSPRKKLNDELVKMARAFAESGPSVNEVSRICSSFKETVRYRYHKFYSDRGIKIQAMPSYARLGLKRLILIARLAPSCESNARSIFNALSELCYLHSFTRVALRGTYVIHVAVPAEFQEACSAVYQDLKGAGLFTELEVLAFDEMTNPPMKPEHYDFVRGRWTFDWGRVGASDSRLPLNIRPRVEKYDRTDLLVIKELEIDAGQSLVRMADTLKVNLSGLEFHYRDHVKGRGLVKGYRLVWQGTLREEEPERTGQREPYLELTLLLRGGTREEVAELMRLLNALPFLWSEAYGSAYCAELFLPMQMYGSLLQYLDAFANKVGRKLEVYTMDQANALRFVISYRLFDGESRRWRLDPGAVLAALGQLAPPA